MNTIEWIVWMIFAFITVFAGIMWFIQDKKHPTGQRYDTNVVVTLLALPRIVFWQILILVLFIFVDFNKLNLLWIYPLVWFGISIKWAKHVDKKDKEGLNK
ncbi:MAG: hypothetical protein NG740_00970 [Omnitrophica bacterium]|nr:hypothetical protein [Candidatus Omnitrophota bacterium]